LGQADLGRSGLHQASQKGAVGASGSLLLAPLSIPRLPATILLVEDETFVREVASQILRLAGYRVLEARNATDALLAFQCHANHLQLLLTDVVLPDRNGADLAHELTTQAPNIKAILISGYPENSVTRKGLQPGWSYLPKPFSADSLLHKIRETLEAEAGSM
jgi:DNA-binding NtrC family response regulator